MQEKGPFKAMWDSPCYVWKNSKRPVPAICPCADSWDYTEDAGWAAEAADS